MAFSFLPRDDSFFDLFDQLSAKALEAARALEETFERWDRLEERVKAIKDLEHTRDDITHRTIDKLTSTFITPLEPEDIHALVSRLDDIVDHIDSVAGRLLIYGVKVPTEEAKLLSQVISPLCVDVHKPV